MSKGINKVILVGNLGGDPDVRYTQGAKAITKISLATKEEWKDKNSGEMHSNTEWHKVIFFNRLAEIAAEYLKKGLKVYVEGKLQTRKWRDKSGNDRYTTEIIANDMQILSAISPKKEHEPVESNNVEANPDVDELPF